MDGRDIGTCVLPDATVKFYLTASPEERAKRMAEIKEAATDLLRVQAQIQAAKATRATA